MTRIRPLTHRPQRSGFTLVELLVVIGIIAVLIGILLPSLASARASAKSVACLANLHTLGQGFAIYAAQNRNYWPPPAEPNNTDPSKSKYWSFYIYEIFNRRPVPADKVVNNTYIQNSVFECPSADRRTRTVASKVAAIGDDDQQQFGYGMSARIHDLPFVPSSRDRGIRNYSKQISRVANPAQTCLLIDNIGAWSGTIFAGGDQQLIRLQAALPRHSPRKGQYSRKGDYTTADIGSTLNERGVLNVLYGDYHAVPVQFTDIPKSIATDPGEDTDPAADTQWWQFWCGTTVLR